MNTFAGKIFSCFFYCFLIFSFPVLTNSLLDFYNNIAYGKAIIRETPFGSVPLLKSPADFQSSETLVKSGDFVYIVDKISAYEQNIVFSKVKSKLKEGYVNSEMLVETEVNVKPFLSAILTIIILLFFSKKIYYYYFNRSV